MTLLPSPDPVFNAPWEARVFAMVVTLQERGVFTWPQWTAALAAQPDLGDGYYQHWLRTLEYITGLKAAPPP
jgi:nitrile hydratase accessory protein